MNARLDATQKRSIALAAGILVLLVVLVLAVAGVFFSAAGSGSGEPSAPPTALEPDPQDRTAAVLESVVDGDTIWTSEGKVRIIGIDTPERGECGYRDAADAIDGLLSRGDTVLLESPPGEQEQDRYDRLLRFVYTESGIDIGLMQLESGNAVARYDSRDNHPRHPKEAEYRAAQTAAVGPDRTVVTTACG